MFDAWSFPSLSFDVRSLRIKNDISSSDTLALNPLWSVLNMRACSVESFMLRIFWLRTGRTRSGSFAPVCVSWKWLIILLNTPLFLKPLTIFFSTISPDLSCIRSCFVLMKRLIKAFTLSIPIFFNSVRINIEAIKNICTGLFVYGVADKPTTFRELYLSWIYEKASHVFRAIADGACGVFIASNSLNSYWVLMLVPTFFSPMGLLMFVIPLFASCSSSKMMKSVPISSKLNVESVPFSNFPAILSSRLFPASFPLVVREDRSCDMEENSLAYFWYVSPLNSIFWNASWESSVNVPSFSISAIPLKSFVEERLPRLFTVLFGIMLKIVFCHCESVEAGTTRIGFFTQPRTINS